MTDDDWFSASLGTTVWEWNDCWLAMLLEDVDGSVKSNTAIELVGALVVVVVNAAAFETSTFPTER